MQIDEQVLANLDFSLYAEDVNTLSDNERIDDILKKYGIEYDSSHLFASNENNYIVLTNYIIENLYNKNIAIPDDIKNVLRYNVPYKTYLLTNIQKRLQNIISDSSTSFFREIETILNLLSLGEYYNILEDYNNYSMDNISKMFREYETFLSQLKSTDVENFNITFNYYLQLIETFNALCTINATSIQRKKNIRPILEILTETINILKFTIELNKNKIDKLNNLLGEQLFYYSHISYINIKGKDLDYILKEYKLVFEKQIDGFTLSKNTDFGHSKSNSKNLYMIFLSNSSYLLLTLLKKLEDSFKNIDPFHNNNFVDIILLYKHNHPAIVKKDFNNIYDFKKVLLNNFSYCYSQSSKRKDFDFTYDAVINDFILEDCNFSDIDIEIIHNIILFTDDIDDYKFINIGEILLNEPRITNDYYEFLKLKTIDIIINKFVARESEEDLNKFISKCINYIENNKVASHLIDAFSKLYLTIALYYSYFQDKIVFNKSKDYYTIFVNTNGYNLLENEYSSIFKTLLQNYGRSYIEDFDLNISLLDDDYIKIGKKVIKDYLEYKNLELKFSINEEISSLVNQILNKDGLDDLLIEQTVSDFISNKLFYGIASVRIQGLKDVGNIILDKGYIRLTLPIVSEYSLIFEYPKVYKSTFEFIFETNKEYIEQNIKNILTGYIKNRALYIDQVTGLKNLNKLYKDLSKAGDESLTFMEIHINSLEYVNKTFSFKAGDIYFKNIVLNMEKSLFGGSAYRLSGVRFGILLSIYEDYNDLLDKLNSLNITINDHEIKSDFTVGIGIGTKERVLRKSSFALNQAIETNQQLIIKS